MRDLEDLSRPQQIKTLRQAAKEMRKMAPKVIAEEIRKGVPEEDRIGPVWFELADKCEHDADLIEAGEDPFAEEEESPEELRAQAEATDKIIEVMKEEKVNTLDELFDRYGIVVKDREDLD
jgi:hypothetical protein